METERVERAYTWHNAKDKDCKESALSKWSVRSYTGRPVHKVDIHEKLFS
jgi:hypothetical protein